MGQFLTGKWLTFRAARARGATWSAEMVLRDDGGSEDLGYPHTVLRADGSLVTAYYFNIGGERIDQNGGPRYIAATIWQP